MNIIIALITGLLFAGGLYLLLQRSFFKLIFGIIIFSYATIFFLFSIGGITRRHPPLLTEEARNNMALMADPLPQALTLTAIVIGLGVQVFAIVLLRKVHEKLNTIDLDNLDQTDQPE